MVQSKTATMKKYEMAYETCIRKAMKKSPKSKPKVQKSKCLKKVSAEIIKNLKQRIGKLKSLRTPGRKSRKASRKMSRKSRKASRKMSKKSRKASRKMSRKSRKASRKMSKKSRKASRKMSRKSRKASKGSKSKKLNAYQKFVKEQSKKAGMKGLSPSKRMKEISKLWNKKNKKM